MVVKIADLGNFRAVKPLSDILREYLKLPVEQRFFIGNLLYDTRQNINLSY